MARTIPVYFPGDREHLIDKITELGKKENRKTNWMIVQAVQKYCEEKARGRRNDKKSVD